VRPAAQNTWINFKVNFWAAHQEFRSTNQTTQHSGFHSANMVIENHPFQGTPDDIAQLTVATASDCGTVATLAATNAKLT
jgi:hypothetical protein